MDETTVRGLIIGAALFVIFGVIAGARKLMAADSKGARRLKLVLKVGIVAVMVLIGFNAPPADQAFIFGVTVVGVVAYWVYQGFKKKG